MLSRDGTVVFDRSREGTINMLEAAAVASPDFSSQDILASYHSLIDLLKARYAYTKLRGLDWEVIRKSYLPHVEKANNAGDRAAYYVALQKMALSIRDAHVTVSGPGPVLANFRNQEAAPIAATLGAQLVELDDGRFVTAFLDPDGPGAMAGWQFGTEIITVDGMPVVEHVRSRPIFTPVGTPESLRLARLENALKFPQDATTIVEYRLPGETEVRSATLRPEVDRQAAPKSAPQPQEISFNELEGGIGYIQWRGFTNFNYKVAVFEEAPAEFSGAPGIIIDLRGNGGGNVGFYFTLASYFFAPDKPATISWVDEYVFDEESGGLVKEFQPNYRVSSPRPDISYPGALVVLVDEHSASAGEYFPQFLQRMGRAVVVGEHSTQGAGGYIERVALPGGLTFQFTKGRSCFAGTDEFNLEAKGVALDIDVPTTLASERAKLEGGDPVLDAGVAALAAERDRLAQEHLIGRPWHLKMQFGATGGKAAVDSPERYAVTFNQDGTLAITADLNRARGEYTLGRNGALSIRIGPTTRAANPPGSLGDDFLKWLAGAQSLQVSPDELLIIVNPAAGAMGLDFKRADSDER